MNLRDHFKKINRAKHSRGAAGVDGVVLMYHRDIFIALPNKMQSPLQEEATDDAEKVEQ